MSHPRPTPRRAAVLVVAGIAVLQLLMVLAFAWPAAKTDPRDVPVVVAGPAAQVAAFAAGVDAVHPGALEVTRVADETAARRAVLDRDAYGAFLLDRTEPQVLVASAASPPVAQMLTTIGSSLRAGEQVPVSDIVSTTADDPRGSLIASALLPIVMTSVLAGALLTLLVSVPLLRLWGVLGLAAVGGALAVALGHGALGGLDGNVVAEFGVIALLITAVAGSVAGAGTLLGRHGIPLMALLMIFLGNPLAGASTAPEMLPQPWGALGQLLPPGAGSQALRSVAFFDGAAATTPVLVLAGWAVAGLAMIGATHVRQSRRAPRPVRTADEPALPVAV